MDLQEAVGNGEEGVEEEEEQVVVDLEDREEDLPCTRGLLENQGERDLSRVEAMQDMVEHDEAQVETEVEEEELLIGEEEQEEEEVDGTCLPLNLRKTVVHHLGPLQPTTKVNINLPPYPSYLLLLLPWPLPPPTFDNSQALRSPHVDPLLLLLRLDNHLLPTTPIDPSSTPLA